MNTNIYEVYLYNDEPITDGAYAGSDIGTVSGWNIAYVESTRLNLNTFPLFDAIISTNDCNGGSEIIEWNGI